MIVIVYGFHRPTEVAPGDRIISFEKDTIAAIALQCDKALRQLIVYRSAKLLLTQVILSNLIRRMHFTSLNW